MRTYVINTTSGDIFNDNSFEEKYLEPLRKHFRINDSNVIEIPSLKKLMLLESLCNKLTPSDNDFAQGLIITSSAIEIYDNYRE